MDYEAITSLQINRWHRIYLNAYWGLTVFTLAVVSIGYPYRSVSGDIYVIHFLLVPVLGLSAVTLVTELLLPRLKRGQNLFMITAATAMCGVLVGSFTIVSFIQSLFVMPLLISIIYIRRQAAFYAFGLNLAGFYVTTFTVDVLRERTTGVQMLLMHMLLVTALLIALTIVARGRQVAEYLQTVLDAKQELFEQNVLLDKLMKTDALTGLYNHRTFHEYLDKQLERCMQRPIPLCLAVIDIDNFKRVNDTYGHRAGDTVLRSVASSVMEALSPGDFAARYGGEEFVVILTERSLEEAFALMESIRKRIALLQHSELDGKSVTVSIGLYEHNGESKEQLFEKADMLLYEAKHSGKNRTAYASLIGN